MILQQFSRFSPLLLFSICVLSGRVIDASCNRDNCLNAFDKPGASPANSQFCSSFLAAKYTATTTGLGPYSSQCKNSPSRVSSACSCLITLTSSSSSASQTISTSSSCNPTATITSTTYPSTCPTTGLSPTTCSTPPASTITVSVTGAGPTCSSSPASTITSVSISTSTVTVTAAATGTTCPQLVANSGFETGNTTDWIDTFSNPGVNFAVADSSSIPGGSHSGSFSGAWISNGDIYQLQDPADFYQTINIPQMCSATEQYLFQAFVKTVGNTCYINAYDNKNGVPFISIDLTAGGSQPPWVEIAMVIQPGAGPFDLVLESSCNTEDPVWIDDITLTPLP